MKSRKRIAKIFCRIALLYLMIATTSTVAAQSFKLYAISDNPVPNLKIVLAWPEPTNLSGNVPITGFNLYRKFQGDTSYPKTPINTTPISRVTKCSDITNILVKGSAEWILIQNALADSAMTLFDPCKLGTLVPATGHTKADSIINRKYDMLMLLALGNYKIAMVLGLAFEDKTVTNGKKYAYKIEGINSLGKFVSVLDSNVMVTAGLFIPPSAPAGVVAEATDSKVQIRWNGVSNVIGFKVYRSLNQTDGYIQVNSSTYTTTITNKLIGNTTVPNSYGFLDFQRYDDSSGMPASHLVNHALISGPSNNITYYYKVSSTDLLGRSGPFSSVVSATPKDMTPPKVPVGLLVTPDEYHGTFSIQWQRVNLDINGHVEIPGVKSYSLFRYESANNPDSGVLVCGTILPDPNCNVMIVSAIDSFTGLRVSYIDKTWYYRVVAKDAANNLSNYSVAVGGVLKDLTKPAVVTNVTTFGDSMSISLKWKPNNEPDINGYMIYRGYCNYGKWVGCPKNISLTHFDTTTMNCIDAFVFLGQVDQKTVKADSSSNNWMFTDKTIPPGSPMCYAYWVKAVDNSGNISGSYPNPSNSEIANIVCQRLHDRTPPEPAIISGLSARDKAVLVEWMGPPTQDIHSYYVYRATKDNSSSYKFMAQVTVPILPDTTSNVIYGKYVPPLIDDCGSIPYEINKYMTVGSFLDTSVDPKQIYWYKVTGVDQNANESDISKAVGVSTFTFTTALDSAPTLTSINVDASHNGLLLKWTPTFNISKHKGFVIFKSTSANGQYYQVAQLVARNQFTDKYVVKGTEYWYRIALLNARGLLSQLSAPIKGKINP